MPWVSRHQSAAVWFRCKLYYPRRFHSFSGINGADSDPTGLVGVDSVPGCVDCLALDESFTENAGVKTEIPGQKGPQSYTFEIAPSNTETLESPLYLAAKY